MVSYADFITLLFAFFVVMYAISSLNEAKYRALSLSIITAFGKGPSKTKSLIESDSPLTAEQPPISLASPKQHVNDAAMLREKEKMKK